MKTKQISHCLVFLILVALICSPILVNPSAAHTTSTTFTTWKDDFNTTVLNSRWHWI